MQFSGLFFIILSNLQIYTLICSNTFIQIFQKILASNSINRECPMTEFAVSQSCFLAPSTRSYHILPNLSVCSLQIWKSKKCQYFGSFLDGKHLWTGQSIGAPTAWGNNFHQGLDGIVPRIPNLHAFGIKT